MNHNSNILITIIIISIISYISHFIFNLYSLDVSLFFKIFSLKLNFCFSNQNCIVTKQKNIKGKYIAFDLYILILNTKSIILATAKNNIKITGKWQTPIMTLPTDYQFLTTDRPNYMKFHKYNENSELNINGLKVMFVRTPHDGNSYAMKVISDSGVLVYSGDTAYLNNPLGEFAYNADALICEATYLKGQDRGNDKHLYAYEAAKIAKAANVGDLYLYHTYPELEKSLYFDEAKEMLKL